MRSVLFRVTVAVWCACLGFALTATVIGAVGISAVRAATSTGKSIAADELTTAVLTAQFGRDTQQAVATGQSLALSDTLPARKQLAQVLTGKQIPAVDLDLGALERIHSTDDDSEWAGIVLLSEQWSAVRSQLTLAEA